MKKILLLIFVGLTSTAHAIKPVREYKLTPDMKGLKYTEYQLLTIDNYSINVWEYPRLDSMKSDKTIIIVGMDGGNMGSMIFEAYAFLQKGFRVIAFDYRGFGKSQDFEINQDFLFYPEFALDLDSVIRAMREKYAADKIGLYSVSMGTHISLLAKERFDFSVAEGFFHDPQKVVERIKINKNKTVLLPPEARAITKAKRKIPMLIFCASKDLITTTEDARAFSKKNKATIIEFEGEHLGGLMAFTKTSIGDGYSDKVVEFLKLNKL